MEGWVIVEEHGAGFDSDWHAHEDHHQVLFAARGAMELVVPNARWFLQQGRAAWLAAGVEHRVTSAKGFDLRTAYLPAEYFPDDLGFLCRVFAATSPLPEMIEWVARTEERHEGAQAMMYPAIATVALTLSEDPLPVALPLASSKIVMRGMWFTRKNLASATLGDAAKAAATSPRTLSRRFVQETGMTWQKYLQTARLLRACELLLDVDKSVTEIAFDVGFGSSSALSTAFRRSMGESPSEFRRRAKTPQP